MNLNPKLLTQEQYEKKLKGLCICEGCVKKASKGNYCYSHISKRWKMRSPDQYAYNAYRNNCRRLKKEILPFEKFVETLQK